MAYKTYYEWPDQGYIPEDAYPLEVIHQDDTGYVLLQVDPMDADSLIVVASIDFNYEREGAVARKDIAGEELAFFRKLNLGNFFEKEESEVIEVLLGLVIYDHLSCDIDSDEYCKLMEEPGAWQIGYQHGAIRQARQIIAKAKGGEDDRV